MASTDAIEQVHKSLGDGSAGPSTYAAVGAEGLEEVATYPDAEIVLCATSGTAALNAVLAAIRAGKTIALANKEVLVMAGGLMMEAARTHGATILPVDSEHNAIHQCLHGRLSEEVARLILTASGGPFRDWPEDKLKHVTPKEALDHPTWDMGDKITIDSSTLMNKGLEVIEARWLFDIGPGPDRRCRAPPVGGALTCRASGRFCDRPARSDRYAFADPVRVVVSRAVGHRAPAAGSGGARPAGLCTA